MNPITVGLGALAFSLLVLTVWLFNRSQEESLELDRTGRGDEKGSVGVQKPRAIRLTVGMALVAVITGLALAATVVSFF